mmetsp:Transcript_42428/g.85829  ORF Transcript_42428/g.85829 Transcript_42428/m.85829 type:complete len:160 (-) Transcript_42428:127-606(-)|eukprot:CAMPEP_0171593294 /NCGR_PEP_ID=MMETSP0990-20121206/22_1 /TAXON_ID=483369 /ORGANISM="non described non described, Strain CCMP2098" /LENGTH=159 /DNA_ID=CAMNT_0012153793 /DNA_START=108 /DNA_END=587 /DNA_ORIENTATION=-
MPHSFGYRARTRDMFSRPFRQTGMIKLSTYMTDYKRGDYVDIKANPAQHKGMPHKHYHGRTGIVYNITKRAVGVRVNKEVNGKILEKRINVRVEHVIPSKCRLGHIDRVVKNEEVKKAVRAGSMQKQNLKRQPILPKAAYTVKLADPETIQPIPFSSLL